MSIKFYTSPKILYPQKQISGYASALYKNSHQILTFHMDPIGQLKGGGSGPPGQLRRCMGVNPLYSFIVIQ